MTSEEVYEVFEGESGTYEGCPIFQGLAIFHKYFPNDYLLTNAAHDQIWSVGIDEAINAGITREDLETLCNMNWMLDEEAFSHFV